MPHIVWLGIHGREDRVKMHGSNSAKGCEIIEHICAYLEAQANGIGVFAKDVSSLRMSVLTWRLKPMDACVLYYVGAFFCIGFNIALSYVEAFCVSLRHELLTLYR